MPMKMQPRTVLNKETDTEEGQGGALHTTMPVWHCNTISLKCKCLMALSRKVKTFENALSENAVNVHPVRTYGRHKDSAGLLS